MIEPKTIVSWNVNGCRSNIFTSKPIGSKIKNDITEIDVNSNFYNLLKQENPDIICLQETKCDEHMGSFFKYKEYPYRFWNQSQGEKARTGNRYSGTCILSKIQPKSVKNHFFNDITNEDFTNSEGRFMIAEFNTFTLVNVYVPNSGSNFDYRTTYWDKHMKNMLDNFSIKNKPLIVTGDFNVVHQQKDIWNIPSFIKGGSPGLFIEERNLMNSFLENYTDMFRYFYPNINKWTWWNAISKSREVNKGWRIDYFLINTKFTSMVEDCTINNNIMGSDHCPIILKLK